MKLQIKNINNRTDEISKFKHFTLRKGSYISFIHQIYMTLVLVHILNTWQSLKKTLYQERIRQLEIGMKVAEKVKHNEKYAVNSCNAYLNLSIENTPNYAVCV